MANNFQPNQEPFPVIFITWKRKNKCQMGLMHVEHLRDVPHIGDEIVLRNPDSGPEPFHGSVSQRIIHYKPADALTRHQIDYVEVFV